MGGYGVGIDIGSNYLKIAEVKKQKDGYYLTNVFNLKIGTTAVDGREAILESQLQDIIRGRILNSPFRKGTLGLSGKDVLYRYMHFPPLPPWKLKMMVEFEIKQGEQDEEDQICYDYRLLSLPKGLSNEYTILTSMAKSRQLDAVIGSLKNAGLKLNRVEPSPLALFNAFIADDSRRSGKTVMFADIGAFKTEIAILSESNLYFIRTLPIGGNAFTQAIQDEFKLDGDKAEEMKVQKGAILIEGESKDPDEEAIRLSNALKRAALQVSSQIQASIRFASNNIRLKDLKVDEYYMSGGGARLKGLLKFWQSVFGIPVKIMNPLKGLKMAAFPLKRIEELTEVPSHYTTAIGLAMSSFDSGMAAMNILPEKEKRRLEFFNRKLPLYAGLFLFFLATIMFTIFNSSVASEHEAIRENLNSTKKDMDGREKTLNAEIDSTRDIFSKYDYITRQGEQSDFMLNVLDSFHRKRPKELWLRSIKSRTDGDTGQVAAELTIYAKESETDTAHQVFEKFKKAMLSEKLIADITVGDIEDHTGSERPLKIITFTVIPSDKFREAN